MADEKNFTCPVCSHQYTVEGEHVPRTLCCLCTLCDQCIRVKLCEGTVLECPLCGTENSTEYIRDNINIISHINEMTKKAVERKDRPAEGKKESCKHAGEENLFCKECKVPVCISCLRDDHLGRVRKFAVFAFCVCVLRFVFSLS